MRVLILGSGASGKAAYLLLISRGYEVSFADEKDINSGENLKNKIYVDRLFEGLSFIVVSPGIALNSPLVVEAKKRRIKVIGELELGTRELKSDIIAVTGTNGKTTTVSIINFLLNSFSKRNFLGGNIGVPVSSFVQKCQEDDIVTLECSSYQLESIEKFHAHIAAILNISEDHLARHKTMKNYILAKQNIALNQTESDYLLVNFDCKLLMQNIPKTKAQIYYFSTKNKVVGCYIKRGCIYFNDNLKEKKLVSLKDIKLIGEHNLSNLLCSCLAVYLETGDTEILKGISNFQGVPHRIEFVRQVGGVSFYNDSKATNIDSTLVALKSFKCRINLILGGSEKGYEFDDLFIKLPKNVRNIAVFGETKPKILAAATRHNFKNIYSCDTLKSCTKLLFDLSKPKDIVLLSPACASFDHFKNFEERGNVFKKIVGEFGSYENALFEDKKKT